MNPKEYLDSNNLWDIGRLKQYAQEHSVYVIQSERIPNVAMLHYQDVVQYDDLWTSFNRMCRGLILNMKNQKVLAYPFDKFFNLDQMPETKYDSLNGLGVFETSEKLDGSMIIGFINPNDNKLTFTTKGSFDSEHGVYANDLPLTSEQRIALYTYAQHGTLMFELIAKPFQIVVDYKKKGYKEGLYLIGYRHNVSHKLVSFEDLARMAHFLDFPVFKTYSFNSLDQLIALAKDLPVLDEGFVLRFPRDLMVKVKGSAYLAAHRFISHLSDRNILEAVADGTADSLVELCPDEFKADVIDKIQYFKKRGREISDFCYTIYAGAPKDSRKEFALWTNKNVEKHLRGFLFQLFDNKPLDTKHIYKVLGEIENVSGVTKI